MSEFAEIIGVKTCFKGSKNLLKVCLYYKKLSEKFDTFTKNYLLSFFVMKNLKR